MDKYKQRNLGFKPEEAPATVEAFLCMDGSADFCRCTAAIRQCKLVSSIQTDTQTQVHKLVVLSQEQVQLLHPHIAQVS